MSTKVDGYNPNIDLPFKKREEEGMTLTVTIKDLHQSYPDTPKGMSDNEWHARVDLAAAYRLTHMYGWTSVVYNHITLRIPDTDTFLINPFGLRYD